MGRPFVHFGDSRPCHGHTNGDAGTALGAAGRPHAGPHEERIHLERTTFHAIRRPLAAAALAFAAAIAAWPAQAVADHTIVATDFRLTASSHAAGASPDASSWTTLTYPGVPNTDDIK